MEGRGENGQVSPPSLVGLKSVDNGGHETGTKVAPDPWSEASGAGTPELPVHRDEAQLISVHTLLPALCSRG